MAFYSVFGISIFWMSLIASIILYAVKRKWHPIMYLIAISFYIFSVGFVIDVFDLKKNGILITLAISSIIMIGIGYYLSTKIIDNKTMDNKGELFLVKKTRPVSRKTRKSKGGKS